MKFRVYRYDPEKDAAPRMQDYDVALDPHDRMLLDALMRLKAQDDSVAFRRSCREGVCGSDAMNINGKNGLACITNLRDVTSRSAAVTTWTDDGPLSLFKQDGDQRDSCHRLSPWNRQKMQRHRAVSNARKRGSPRSGSSGASSRCSWKCRSPVG